MTFAQLRVDWQESLVVLALSSRGVFAMTVNLKAPSSIRACGAVWAADTASESLAERLTEACVCVVRRLPGIGGKYLTKADFST
ncbi:hypothetical protein AXY46_14440 [Achromobacter xylosoxidans]|nr:hypothetical protein AXY46_14440 [Achromobacter xylosoxidans]